MQIFEIKQRSTGAILWVGSAQDEANALDAMAHEAGYVDADHLPMDVQSGGFIARALNI
ncbi:hypothetical protein ACLBWX_22540 [Methylobacterium sp. M6A4_1b]